MAVRGQLPDSLLQPPCCADSRRSGARERPSIFFTDCKALWMAYFFITTFPAAALGGSKTVLPAGCLVSVRRPFFAAVWTLYIHEEMIRFFLNWLVLVI